MYNCVLALFSAIVLLITSCTLLSICSHFALVRYLQILSWGFLVCAVFLSFGLPVFCLQASLCRYFAFRLLHCVVVAFFSAFFLVSCVVFIAKKSAGCMFLAC